jgi:methyl-accepting chemotaxis protein
MKEIAQVSIEQSDDINRTNRALGQIEATTHQNATLVERASTAAAALQDEAGGLALAMRFFSTDDESGSS